MERPRALRLLVLARGHAPDFARAPNRAPGFARAPNRALRPRVPALLLGFSFAVSFASGCNPKLEELNKERSERLTLGQEIYKVVCRRVAGTELPGDIDGSETEVLCLGDPTAAEAELERRRATLPARLVALAERRQSIADALNEGFANDTAGGIEDLMSRLMPYYDPPEEVLQEGTRRTAAMLNRLVADGPALEAFARYGRQGMVPPEGDFGVTRALLSHRRISDVLTDALLPLTEDALAPALSATLKGLALELATTELETAPDSDTCRSRDLYLRSEKLAAGESSEIASGTPLYTAVRDVRGLPIPTRDNNEGGVDLLSACGTGGQVRPVPYPFVDANQDGFADVDGVNFSLDPSFSGTLPEPFPIVGESPSIARDAAGRARALTPSGNDATRSLYLTRDADSTVLAAALRVGGRAFAPGSGLLDNFAASLPAVLGDSKMTERSYGALTHRYSAIDPARSPLVKALHAGSALTADPLTDEAAELGQRLLREHEPALMKSFEPLLDLERLTRPGNDHYETAHLEPNNTFWDDMLWEAEKLSRWRTSKDGETALEAVMRATLGFGRNFQKPGAPVETLVDPVLLSRQGAILAMMMRFKDEWRGNPRPRTERPPGDPEVIGSLSIPVDRSKAPTPITCGVSGCGGVIKGSPFERWAMPMLGKKPNSPCMIPALSGRPEGEMDCGEPSNQSLLHRSMGLMAELAGRKQCNRPITVRDLFDFATDTTMQTNAEKQELERTIAQAEQYLAEDYTCPVSQPNAPCHAFSREFPAAFPARTGGLKPAIQECALLDLKDVGRTFGLVLTNEYRLEIPNPWVRRYLEDIARAADPALQSPACAPGVIVDPTVTPTCVTNAAILSRAMFEELPTCQKSDPTCIDTLAELVEFLLDDKELFQSEVDARDLRPDARTLTKVLFTPAGVSEGFQLFDPLLTRNAPPVCNAVDTRPFCNPDDTKRENDDRCCLKSLDAAPLRFRLDTFYGSTSLVWEHAFRFKDGKQLSFLDAGISLADAFNRLDVTPGAEADFEDQDYAFTRLGNLLALHYDSPENLYVQGKDPNKPGYRKLTGLVRYEELLADLADDGTLDLEQKAPHGGAMFQSGLSFGADQQLGFMAKSLDLLQALDALSFKGGDGISAMARQTESMLNPHAHCAGETGDKRVVRGRGACHATTPAAAPIALRDGRDYKCFRDGTCFDGSKAGVPKRFVSSVDLLLDALWDIDDRRRMDPALERSTRALLGDVLDAFSAVENGRLKDRRLRALTLAMGDYARERWAQEKAKGTLATLGQRDTDDTIDMLTNPAVAGGIELLRGLRDNERALPALQALLFSLLDLRAEPSASRALLSFGADALQQMPGDANANALLRTFAFALAPNVEAVLAGKEKELDVEGSVAWNNVFTMGVTGQADTDDVLGRLTGAMLGARSTDPSKLVPMTVLYDALIDINRVDPLAAGQFSAEDYAEAFKRIAEVMLDERRGFERMYNLVRCSRNSDDPICD